MNVERQYTSIEQMRGDFQASSLKSKRTDAENNGKIINKNSADHNRSFDEILFSKHASRRLETRNIDLSEEQRFRLQDAASQARKKGMKESLVMVDDLAFIVNVKNNTVITAVNDTEHAVYTNIDGAIIN